MSFFIFVCSVFFMVGGGNRRKRRGREEGLKRTGSGRRGKAIYAHVDCIVFLRGVSSYVRESIYQLCEDDFVLFL